MDTKSLAGVELNAKTRESGAFAALKAFQDANGYALAIFKNGRQITLNKVTASAGSISPSYRYEVTDPNDGISEAFLLYADPSNVVGAVNAAVVDTVVKNLRDQGVEVFENKKTLILNCKLP